MKIVLNDWQDVQDFVSMLSPDYLLYACPGPRGHVGGSTNNLTVRADGALPADITKPADPMAAAQYGHDLHPEGYRPTEAVGQVLVYGDWSKTEELPTDASADKAVAETSAALRDAGRDIGSELLEAVRSVKGEIAEAHEALVTVELDSTGRRWDEEIDSATKKQTKAGAWVRSKRRDLTDERYNERAAELIAEAQANWAPDKEFEEPVATETHALPVDDTPKKPDPETEPAASKPTVDLAALIEASADASLELSGSMGDLMAASRTFIEEYGVQAMNELRAAVAPDPNNPAVGLSVGSLTPAQRALVQACIQNYPS